MWHTRWVVVLVAATVFGCAAGPETASDATSSDGNTSSTSTDGRASTAGGTDSTATTSGTVDKAVAGEWRVLSAVVYFKNGKTSRDVKTTLPTRRLTVGADGSWQFGSSNGTWGAASTEDTDWTKWEVKPYGPTRKLIVNNWAGGTSTGPIEESGNGIESFWVIYPYTSEGYGEGTVWMKFGKDN